MEEINLEANNSLEPSNPNKSNQAENNRNDQLPSIWGLLEESWQIFANHWQTFIGLSMVVLATPILVALIVLILNRFYPNSGLMFLAFISPIFLIILLLSSWGTISLACAAKSPDLSWGELLSEGWRKIIPYWWIMFLQGLIITGGYVLFFIPGLIFSVWFSLTIFVLVAEDIKGMDALLKSKEYVKGYWGSVFWRLLFLLILNYLIAFMFSVLEFITGPSSGQSLFREVLGLFESLAANLIILPVVIIYIYRIYFYLKKIKHNLFFIPSQREKILFIISGVLGLLAVILILFAVGVWFILPSYYNFWQYRHTVPKSSHFI